MGRCRVGVGTRSIHTFTCLFILDLISQFELEAEAHDVLTEQRDTTSMHNVQHQFFDKIWQSEHSELYYEENLTMQISRSTTRSSR